MLRSSRGQVDNDLHTSIDRVAEGVTASSKYIQPGRCPSFSTYLNQMMAEDALFHSLTKFITRSKLS